MFSQAEIVRVVTVSGVVQGGRRNVRSCLLLLPSGVWRSDGVDRLRVVHVGWLHTASDCVRVSMLI